MCLMDFPSELCTKRANLIALRLNDEFVRKRAAFDTEDEAQQQVEEQPFCKVEDVYDAFADVGQIVGNVPLGAGLEMVKEWMAGPVE